MKNKSLLTEPDYWANYETRILEVVTLAIKMLSKESFLPLHEDKLNRKLYQHIHRANRSLYSLNKHLDFPPFYEARIQPDADDIERAVREDKRPDFQWSIYDHGEPNPDKSAKHYVLECKRLGTPAGGGSWKLNENYVMNGMFRFTDAGHGYGKSSKSGVMIGYIQSMNEDDILNEVNNSAKNNSLSELKLSVAGWKVGDISRLDSCLIRPNVLPTPFDLRHLWIDLRP